jgi:tripartite-type tricarboxylate transporter receptor subunit TctC
LAGTSSSLLVAVAVNPAITYKHEDFTPIYLLASDPVLICSLPDQPWKNLDELVAYAKKNPGKLNYGSTGLGTTSFFTMELFKLSYGLDIVPVHFQGSGPIRTAILGGHVNLCSTTFGPMASLVKAGKINPLVTSALNRIPDFPGIPTLAERGFAEASMNMWMGIFAPGKCPGIVVEKLVRATEKAIKDPSIATQLRKIDILPDYRTGEETRKLMEKDWKMITQVVQKLGIGK